VNELKKNSGVEIKGLLNIIERVDDIVESTLLSASEKETKTDTHDHIVKLRNDVETKWDQRTKVNHIQEGSNSNKYFHLICN
jgi:hypothetical protein